MKAAAVVASEASVLVLAERGSHAAVFEELARCGRYRLLGRVESVADAVDAARVHGADILVIDISTSARLREVVGRWPGSARTKVVVVSALPVEAALLTAMGAGARGFLRRPLSPGVLEQAISAVKAGGTFVDPGSTTWLVDVALHGHRARSGDGLTLRQAQIVQLARAGMTRREIARVLDLSPATVKSHLHGATRRRAGTSTTRPKENQ